MDPGSSKEYSYYIGIRSILDISIPPIDNRVDVHFLMSINNKLHNPITNTPYLLNLSKRISKVVEDLLTGSNKIKKIISWLHII